MADYLPPLPFSCRRVCGVSALDTNVEPQRESCLGIAHYLYDGWRVQNSSRQEAAGSVLGARVMKTAADSAVSTTSVMAGWRKAAPEAITTTAGVTRL
jgi:hypothetical protein